MTQHVYGSGPCTTLLGFDTVEAGSPKRCAADERLAPTSLPHTSLSGSACGCLRPIETYSWQSTRFEFIGPGSTRSPSLKTSGSRIVEHEIPILNTAKFAAIVGIGPKFGYNSDQRLGFIPGPSLSLLDAQENAVDELPRAPFIISSTLFTLL